MTFLEFTQNKAANKIENEKFFEAFKTADVEKANTLIAKLLDKKLNGSVILWAKPFDCICDGKNMLSYRFIYMNDSKIKTIIAFNYLKSEDSSSVYSIDLYNTAESSKLLWNGKAKSSLTLITMGSSVVYFIPMICQILSSNNFKMSTEEGKALANEIYAESKYYVGAFAYTLCEGMTDESIAEQRAITEGSLDDVNDEYKRILDAVRGGATTLDEIKFTKKESVPVEDVIDEKTANVENSVKTSSDDPEVAFKKMQVYIKSVITGMQPGVILCGAPGIGKTFRVKQQLKAAGYKEGVNMYTIKGTESPRQLYIDMYEFKKKGNIIVIDDADALVGKNAPEVAINILKAALDSTADDEGRLVSYKVTGNLKDEEGNPIPKRMYFNAGVIVITNYAIGQLDTALRGRVFTQSLEFDSAQVLQIIKNMMSNIDPVHLSAKSKENAYNFLEKLANDGVKMEISIRTFAAAARLYSLTEDEMMSEEDVQAMIKEQMENQALRGGKHY